MRTYSALCRWLWVMPIALLAFVFDGRRSNDLLGWSRCVIVQMSAPLPKAEASQVPVPDRNLVNTKDKDIALDFALEPVKKNFLWEAHLGKESYAGPVVARGKIFVCTNNENPRDPARTGDAGV